MVDSSFSKIVVLVSLWALSMVGTTEAAYAFVGRTTTQQAVALTRQSTSFTTTTTTTTRPSTWSSSTSRLQMVDDAMIQGAGVAIAGLVAGIGLVAFTEQQGERAKVRGSGLSDSMSTRITGGLMEDVEVSSVSDLGSLTAQLEQALKETTAETGKTEAEAVLQNELELSEEEKKRIAEEADDGW